MRWMILIAIAGLLAMGCGTPSGNSDDQRLADTQWLLTAWSASSLEAADYLITADFGKSDISGRSAVNAYGGPYTLLRGGSISIGDLQATLMGGPEDAMRAELLYFELLSQVRKYSLTETNLTMMNEGNQELLVFQKRRPNPSVDPNGKPKSRY
jgi:heat shock protein HslJ